MTTAEFREAVADTDVGTFESPADSDSLIVVFGSLANNGFHGMPPFEFVNLLDELPVAKLFLRDIDQAWYHRGVRGLASSLPDLVDALRPHIEPRKRVVFTGHSSGGYAALILGTLLGVDEVIATSPQSFISRRLRLYHNDHRWPDEIRNAYTSPTAERKMFDLKPWLKRSTAATRLHIYYATRHQWDFAHAERLRRIRNVELHPTPTMTHSVARYLRDQGELLHILRRAAEGTAR